ncbi:MAG: Flp pilus assembly complex ATPase component TadA [Gammaproteobacteria bacterium]|nr:Flp pilus assembly complex ATPase component TadA [Gammaproteobacteria bacterium]
MSVAISQTRVGVETHLALEGPINDDVSVSALQVQLDNCIDQYQINIVLDMVSVPLVNSQCLEVLLEIQDRLLRFGGSLRLTNLSKLLKQVFYITGADKSIECDSGSSTGFTVLAPDNRGAGNKRKLGEILLEKGLVTEKDIEYAVLQQRKSGKKLGDILIEDEYVSEADLLTVLAEQHDLPFLQIRTGLYDTAVVKLLDRDFAKGLAVMPLFKINNTLILATTDPQAIPTFDAVSEKTGCNIKPVLATSENILEMINEARDASSNLSELIGGLDIEADLELLEGQADQKLDEIDGQSGSSPVINLINNLVQRAVRDGASDIHIEPGRGRSRIRFRIDGVLYQVMTPPSDIYPALVSRLKVMAKLDIAERRLPQDGRIQVLTQGKIIDLRLSTLPGIFGEKVVLRVLDKDQSIMQIDKLGMTQAHLAVFRQMLKSRHGLFLVTGPTGSGKTSTLYSAINYLNSIEKSIVTIEDPVEYQLDVINQNQVRDGIGLGFAKLFKHVLRQDPDIVMVGEIRDRETAEISVQAALTGHLVLSTLHTNDAIGAITRLLDMGIQPFLLSSAMIGVMAQRLIRRVCPKCSTQYTISPEALQSFGIHSDVPRQLVKGKGCTYCYDSGYKGRMAVHEIFAVDSSAQHLMSHNPSRDELDKHLKEKEVITLFDSALDAAFAGQTSLEEAMRLSGT